MFERFKIRDKISMLPVCEIDDIREICIFVVFVREMLVVACDSGGLYLERDEEKPVGDYNV